MLYQGSCHCGKIAYAVDGDLSRVVECKCSHCRRKGYLWWFVPREQMQLKSPESALATYKFNKHIISHHFCRDCGCAPFATGIDPRTNKPTAAINVRCLEGVEPKDLEIIPVDGRSH